MVSAPHKPPSTTLRVKFYKSPLIAGNKNLIFNSKCLIYLGPAAVQNEFKWDQVIGWVFEPTLKYSFYGVGSRFLARIFFIATVIVVNNLGIHECMIMHNKEVPPPSRVYFLLFPADRAGPIYLSSSCPWPINLSSAIYSGQQSPATLGCYQFWREPRQETRRELGSNKTIKIATTSPGLSFFNSISSWWIS